MVAMVSPMRRPMAAPRTNTGKNTPDGMGRDTAIAVKTNCWKRETWQPSNFLYTLSNLSEYSLQDLFPIIIHMLKEGLYMYILVILALYILVIHALYILVICALYILVICAVYILVIQHITIVTLTCTAVYSRSVKKILGCPHWRTIWYSSESSGRSWNASSDEGSVVQVMLENKW